MTDDRPDRAGRPLDGNPLALTVTPDGSILEWGDDVRRVEGGVDELFRSPDPEALARTWHGGGTAVDPTGVAGRSAPVAPIGRQEVWACGVTYLRSRDARRVESASAGGDVFYDLVYDAERPEIFFKATPHRVVGPGGRVRIRRDSTWNVPEPELTLAVSSSGRIFGHTIGNDMSSRSIEGENPLYLPQAKVYDGCAAIGPRLVVGPVPGPDTAITMTIARAGATLFAGDTSVGRIKRPLDELVSYLFRDNSFPDGVYVMTGTGIVPGDDLTLRPGDVVSISIDGIGTLENHVTVAD